MGFSSDEVKTVIRGTLEEPHLAQKLINDLKVRGDVLSLCYIPLVCSMVIYVYGKLKGQLPTTLTQLYENFILQTIRRHIERNVQSYQPEDIRGLNERDLPPDVGRDFKELCQFAYLSLKENNPKMTFSSLELHQHMKQSGYLGLITEYGEDGNQFLHLSIQEFLASWWIAKYEEKTQEIFNEHLDNDHFKMCLRFTAGLTHNVRGDHGLGLMIVITPDCIRIMRLELVNIMIIIILLELMIPMNFLFFFFNSCMNHKTNNYVPY
jgi:hypothetical protein